MADNAGEAAPDQVQPVAVSGNRIASLDFIRGFAVMGILLANIVAFGQPFTAYMYPEAFLTEHGPAEGWMWVAQFVLVDGKMRGLFTLLFGAGLYLFMEKAWERGATRMLQARRLLWLLVFGLVHFFFIWRGDILVYYSLAGFIALVCMRWSAKTQLHVGLLGFLAGAIMYLGLVGFPYLVAETPMGEQPEWNETREEMREEVTTALADDDTEAEIIGFGDYAGFVRHNFSEHLFDPLFNFFIFVFETLPLILIGMALYRYGFFSGGLDRSKMIKWGWIGVLVGSALTLPIALWAMQQGFSYWGSLAAFVGFSPIPRLAVVLGLAALLAVYGARAHGWLGQRVSAAGRAAFTNYLGTSIVMISVFHGWGGGLFGELTRGGLYVVVVLTWVLMLAWSKPWLERFRYGPLEWLWRCLTYGRLFPLRR